MSKDSFPFLLSRVEPRLQKLDTRCRRALTAKRKACINSSLSGKRCSSLLLIFVSCCKYCHLQATMNVNGLQWTSSINWLLFAGLQAEMIGYGRRAMKTVADASPRRMNMFILLGDVAATFSSPGCCSTAAQLLRCIALQSGYSPAMDKTQRRTMGF